MQGSASWARTRQIATYLVVGGSAFVIDFGLLALLKSGLGVAAWLAAVVGFSVSTVYSFWLQRHVTFSSELHLGHSVVRYGILLGFNTLVTAGIVEAFDRWWGMYLLGKVVSTALMTAWNFPIMKHWVYPQRRSGLAPASAASSTS